ncbi:MAG: ABC transporter ATP-binding protein [Oscillospiraceae bacterium]|nr:ABC transporter ATP-binding protein [Oscillospiraceae bacterium]
MASITLKDVSKVYPGSGGARAVEKFSLEIADREFVVIVGPSGCGKSTTFRMIAGLEEISEGSVYIGDTLVNNVPPKDRNIAMVFQSYALYPHMSVYKNMAFAMKMRRVKKQQIDIRVRETAALLGISHLLARKPRALSGGESQRVALGRAMVRNPEVFLLDEPLSNLDAKLRADMRAEIVKLHKKLETTFIYVTHDQTEAMTMGDRIVLMNGGHIMQVDSPKNIYDHPVNTFVAGFIGSPRMNFADCAVEERDGELFARLGENGEHLISLGGVNAERGELRALVGKKATFGIRPEHLSAVSEAAPPGEGFSGGTADIIEALGAETNIYVDLPDGLRFIVREFNDKPVFRGQVINLRVMPDKIHIFDAETGDAITGRRRAAENTEPAAQTDNIEDEIAAGVAEALAAGADDNNDNGGDGL